MSFEAMKAHIRTESGQKGMENPKAMFAFDKITLRAFEAIVERYRSGDVGNFVALLTLNK